MINSIVISSGHGGKVAGAIGILNEHNEAVRVVEKVAEYLRQMGVAVHTFHDNTSTTQARNLSTIVGFHNAQSRELDVSIHFNAASRTDEPRGTEVLYYDNAPLASTVAGAISGASGLKNRGGKQDKGLYFLSKTKKPAILIEVCFVDSSADANIYNGHFDAICKAIAESISGRKVVQSTPQPIRSNQKPVNTTKYPVQPVSTGNPIATQVEVIVNSLNCRQHPDKNSPILFTAKKGQRYNVTANINDWHEVIIDNEGHNGYLFGNNGQYLSLVR